MEEDNAPEVEVTEEVAAEATEEVAAEATEEAAEPEAGSDA